MKFFYATNSGIGRNDENLPKPILKKLTGSAHVLRFAFDEAEKKLYVQDESSNMALRNGSDSEWGMLNNALLFLDKNFDARFLDKAEGDPPGTQFTRRASSYKKAWGIISRAMREDLGMEPFDVSVSEFVPAIDIETEPAALKSAGGKPVVNINKTAFKTGGDVDYSQINNAVATQYLSNVREFAKDTLSKDEFAEFEKKWEKHIEGSVNSFFAINHNGGTKVLKAKKNEQLNEQKVRESAGMEGYAGPVMAFNFDEDRKEIKLLNHSLQSIYADAGLKSMAMDIKNTVSRATRIPEDQIVFAFDPAMSIPHSTSLDRYRIAWDYIKNIVSPTAKIKPTVVKVAELPIEVKNTSALVTSQADEDRKAPGSRELRATNNITLEYPFIVLDNRAKDAGRTSRALLNTYAEYIREVEKVPYSHNWIQMTPQQQSKEIKHMLDLGMTRNEVVDFFAPRANLAKRAEVKALATEAWRGMRKAASKQAAMDGTINDWWHIGTQEELNRAQHIENKPTAKPFNLRVTKVAPPSKSKTYEEMLHPQHDGEMNYQKTTEQLLRESRT